MDSSAGQGPQAPPPSHCRNRHFHHRNHNVVPPPPPHHHHHFHVSPHCPIHSHVLHLQNHSPACPIFSSSFHYPQYQNPRAIACPNDSSGLQVSASQEIIPNNSLAMPEEKTVELEVEEEQLDEEDEDPVFVLTEEWREFFAKSEARRRLAKKQAKKKGKNRIEQ